MQRLVIDTNAALSALLWGGLPGQLLARRDVQLFSSAALLDELKGVLQRPKFEEPLLTRGLRAADLFDAYLGVCQLVEPLPIPRTSRDSDDDEVLACALAAQADAIVSGDSDLLVLGQFQGIPILTPAQAVLRLDVAI